MLILTSQSVPEYPTGQMHLNLAIISTHSPPLRHGDVAHSSISVLQSRPILIQQRNKLKKKNIKFP